MIIFKVIIDGSTLFKYLHMKFFSCFCIIKYQKCLEKFSYWSRVNISWFKSMRFFYHCLEPIQGSLTFSNLGILLNINLKTILGLTWRNSCQFGEWFLTDRIFRATCPKHSQNRCFYHALILSTPVKSTGANT